MIKTIVIVSLTMLLLAAFISRDQGVVNECKRVKVYRGDDRSYGVVMIDGCQYIECSVYNGAVLVHKGNCSNPCHTKP